MIWLAKHGKELKPAVYEFPSELDKETAFAKLETMGTPLLHIYLKQGLIR